MKVGHLIKLRRIELGLTQKELAERCGYTNKSTISRIESGERDIPVRQLKKIAAALGMETEDLVVEAYKTALEDRDACGDLPQPPHRKKKPTPQGADRKGRDPEDFFWHKK